ncbi:MAG: hypothetical protein FD146_2630 [Anaerolineaceae bacterium]|nr:MAG: hypothetical protein FD146_2630 [Anaerolineaceae bacterium]
MALLKRRRKINKNDDRPAREITGGGTLSMSGTLIVVGKNAEGDIEGIRVADDHKSSSSVDFDASGNQTYSIRGKSSQNEDGTLETCQLLVQHLNQLGAHWNNCTKIENDEPIDCRAYDTSDVLEMQVVRISNEAVRQNLGQTGVANTEINLDAAVENLRCAIRHKEKYPLDVRSKIVLVINALDTPGHAVYKVAETFRSKYGKDVAALGFKAIWVVGPIVDLVVRLDQS